MIIGNNLTGPGLGVGSFNCNGLGNPEKRRLVLNWLKNKPDKIFMLQESHSVPATEDSWRRSWEGDIYFNHGSSNSTGVTFLVKSNSDIKICSHKIIVQGRVSLLEIEHDSTNYCLVNVYCPNDNVTHVVESTFLNTLSRTRDDFCIFGGDWNTILDNNMDKHGGNRAHSNNNRQILLHQMMADHGLCDILRLCKGDDRIYTHVNKQHKTQTRLDFFLIDANIVNFPLCTPDISHGFKSDHSYISLTVQGTPVNRGKGYWKFNNQHLENENFVNEVRNIINATINSDHDSKSGLWDVIKFKIKDFAIRFGKKEKEKKDTERKKLIKEIEDIKKDTNFMQNDDLRQKFFDFESKLDDFIKQDINGAITRARIKWTEEGERSTKYFFGIEKSNAKKKSINKLIDSNNADLTSHTDISNHVVNFYQNLYNSTQSNAQAASDYIDSSNLNSIDEDLRNSLDSPLTLLEMDNVISGFKNNKSPGWDGLTAEFYKFFWDDLKLPLYHAFLEAADLGVMSPSQRIGILTLIPKPKSPSELKFIKNWRPITLLNVDYKIFTHVIKNRILHTIPKLISNSQSGFQKGKSTTDNLILMYLTLEHYQDNSEDQGMIMQVDLMKAFDSVEHKFLFKVLASMGFGNYLINLVKVAFNACMSFANINGHLSSPIYLLRGLHQGSPLSPILFLLVAQVLTNKLLNNNQIKGMNLDGVDILLSLFADDTDLFLEPSVDCIRAVISELNDFGLYSGCKPNLNKTKCIPLGSTRNDTVFLSYLNDTYSSDEEPFVVHSFTALGINFDNHSSIRDICSRNYLEKLEKASAAVKSWSKRDLTLLGKCTLIKSIIMSQFTYLIQPLLTPCNNIVKAINTLIFNFLWGNKKDKIKRDIVCSPREQGGLGLFYPIDFITSLKVSLISKLLDNSFKHAWKDIITRQLKFPNHIIICIENGLLANNNRGGFSENLLNSYQEWKSKCSIAGECTINHCIWGNDKITDIGSSLWNTELIYKGIMYLTDFITENGDILPYPNFLRRWGLSNRQVSTTNYASIKLAIRRFHNPNTSTRNTSTVNKLLSVAFFSGINGDYKMVKGMKIREQMATRSPVENIRSLRKWSDELGLDDIDWSSVFTNLFYSLTNNFKLIQYQYKLLHKISTCRYMRFKMKIDTDSPICSQCKNKLETLDHIFLECVTTGDFVNKLNIFIRINIDPHYDDPLRYFLITLTHSDPRVNFLNAVCTWFIGKSYQNNLNLIWGSYINYVKTFLKGEKPHIYYGIINILLQ